MKTTKDYLDAIDTLTMRVHQASGGVHAVLTVYTEQPADGMEHILSASSLLDALSAISELLTQAETAAKGLSGCSFQPR